MLTVYGTKLYNKQLFTLDALAHQTNCPPLHCLQVNNTLYFFVGPVCQRGSNSQSGGVYYFVFQQAGASLERSTEVLIRDIQRRAGHRDTFRVNEATDGGKGRRCQKKNMSYRC